MHLQHQSDIDALAADGLAVIGQACSIGGAHVDESCARLFHHFGDAEAATDLHTFSAAHCHVAPGRERGQHEQNGSRVVVDDHGVFGTHRARDETTDTALPTSATASGEIEFEILRTGRQVQFDRRATEVGVGDHTGGVDDGNQKRGGDSVGDGRCATRITECDGFTGRVHEKRMRKAGGCQRTSQ